PLRLVLDTVTATTATISFNAIGTSVFDYEFGPTGYTQGTGTMGSGGNPLVVTGMNEQTTYDVYVRANCSNSSNGVSGWVGPITVQTGCSSALSGTYTVDATQPASSTNFT